MNVSPASVNHPRLSAYLKTLPLGLDSYPEVKTRAFFSIELQKLIEPVLPVSQWPEALRHRVKNTWKPDDWIAAVTYSALSTLVRDCLWKNEEQFYQGMFDIAKTMYQSAFSRALMLLLSPSLAVMGATKRWGNFHQGTTLTVIRQTKCSADLLLEYPSNLFSESCLRSFGAVFCSAIIAAKGKAPTFTITTNSPTKASYDLRWEF